MTAGANNPKEKEADDKAKEDREKSGMFSWIWEHLNPFKHLGSIFKLAIFGLIGYFLLAKTGIKDWFHDLLQKDWAQNLVQGLTKLVSKVSPEWGAKLGVALGVKGALGDYFGQLTADQARTELASRMSPTVLNIIAKDDTTWKDFLSVVTKANGGPLTKPEELQSSGHRAGPPAEAARHDDEPAGRPARQRAEG